VTAVPMSSWRANVNPAVRDVDVVVVGGGPAGMAAAGSLAMSGASVVLVDENESLGGQYYKRRSGSVLDRYGDFRRVGTEMAAWVRRAGADVVSRTQVWGVADDRRTLLLASRGDTASAVRGQVLIVATGAQERVIPFPGWQLPGVVTAGLALHLATIDRVPVGKRVAVAGTGPFLLPVACQLLDVGCEVVGVFERSRPYRPAGNTLRSLLYPHRLIELGGYLARLRKAGVAVRQGTRVLEAVGESHVEGCSVADIKGQTEWIGIDALAVGDGFRPVVELLDLLGASTKMDPHSGSRHAVVDEYGATSIPWVYAAGESAGVAGAQAAVLRGRLAGVAAGRALGLRSCTDRERERLLARHRRATRFAEFSAVLFPPHTEAARSMPDATEVCRCEGITAGQIRAVVSRGWDDLHSTKGATRAGMGLCQGRECGFAVSCLTTPFDSSPSVMDSFSVRMPLRPILIRDILAMPTSNGNPE